MTSLLGDGNTVGDITLTFDIGGKPAVAKYSSTVGAAYSKVLTFVYTVAAGDNDNDGISWGPDAITLPVGASITLKDDPTMQANISHVAQVDLADYTVDTGAPVLESMVVVGSTVTLTYSEMLDESQVPDASAFILNIGSGQLVPVSVSVSGNTVVLEMGSLETTLTYTRRLSLEQSTDTRNNKAASLTKFSVHGAQ